MIPFGLGGYLFNPYNGICHGPLQSDIWLGLWIAHIAFPLVILLAMVIASYLFVHKYSGEQRAREMQDSIEEDWRFLSFCKGYCHCNLPKKCSIGVFGAIALSTIGLFIFSIAVTATTLSLGPERLPPELIAAQTFIILSLLVITGIFQLYFRPEFRKPIVRLIKCRVYQPNQTRDSMTPTLTELKQTSLEIKE